MSILSLVRTNFLPKYGCGKLSSYLPKIDKSQCIITFVLSLSDITSSREYPDYNMTDTPVLIPWIISNIASEYSRGSPPEKVTPHILSCRLMILVNNVVSTRLFVVKGCVAGLKQFRQWCLHPWTQITNLFPGPFASDISVWKTGKYIKILS